MKNMTKQEYQDYINKKTPNSSLFKDICFAFLIGGLICIIGQLIGDGFKSMGLDKETAAASTSVVMVFLGAFLTGIGVYDRIARVAGAGTIVPITGFANSVVSPAMEFKSEGLVLGLAAKMFIIAGPVIVYGILSSVIVGIIKYVVAML
ncbi:MAG: stage V sporulation protein AC [Ruminococcaceae bacterium]|nr:stage V sporulation protein AC [Oscillospiraceae bacterium]